MGSAVRPPGPGGGLVSGSHERTGVSLTHLDRRVQWRGKCGFLSLLGTRADQAPMVKQYRLPTICSPGTEIVVAHIVRNWVRQPGIRQELFAMFSQVEVIARRRILRQACVHVSQVSWCNVYDIPFYLHCSIHRPHVAMLDGVDVDVVEIRPEIAIVAWEAIPVLVPDLPPRRCIELVEFNRALAV